VGSRTPWGVDLGPPSGVGGSSDPPEQPPFKKKIIVLYEQPPLSREYDPGRHVDGETAQQ